MPTILTSDQLGNDITRLTYIFNRWIKMLKRYGKLDNNLPNEHFSLIAKVIKSPDVDKDIKQAVQRGRDAVLSTFKDTEQIIEILSSTLEVLCQSQENQDLRIIKQHYADQGMTERYRPLSRRLANVKITKTGRKFTFTDFQSDDSETIRIVRRIVEKRAAQTVHRIGKRDRESNRFRQSVRRATSFSLYYKRFTAYDRQLRAPGTHWKVTFIQRNNSKILEAKQGFKTYEEAVAACNRFMIGHPDDTRPMSAYKCDHCGHWHIGHMTQPDNITTKTTTL